MLDFLEEGVDEILRNRVCGILFAAQTPQNEKEHQRNHLETTERGVRNVPGGIQDGLPRCRHDLFIDVVNHALVRIRANSKQALEH